MVCNYSKTDLTIFGFNGPGESMVFSGTLIRPNDMIKILGIMFEKNLKWGNHVALMLRKANSSTYSIRQLNRFLSRDRLREVIQAFVVSHVMYAAPVWADGVSMADARRIDTMLFKTMRLLCRDHLKRLTNMALCEAAKLRSFKSLRKISNSTMLSKLVMHPNDINYLTERLIMQSTFNSRQLGMLRFFDMSTKRVGKSSFVNRAKDICEAIPFDWPDISHQSFKRKIKESTPLLLRD